MTFNNPQWLIIAFAGLAILAPLAWRAWSSPSRQIERSKLALGFRILGVLILLLSLLDPQRISERSIKGANVLAIVADNSEGMRIKDSGEILDRGELMRHLLTGRDSTWIGELEEEYQLRNYTFDRNAQRVGNFNGIDFDGDRSNITESLKSLNGRLSNLPVAGVVLLTDGNTTDAFPTADDLAGLPPLYPVVMGSDEPIADIALGNVTLRQSAFDDSPLSLQLAVSSSGIDETNVEVSIAPLQLKEGNQSSLVSRNIDTQTKTTKLSRDKPNQTMQFNWTPDGSGIQFFEVSATQKQSSSEEEEDVRPLQEATRKNNARIVMADRGKTEYRILYVTGRPNWEYKFLNRSLSVDPQLNLVGLLRVANREPKFEFKGRAGESSNPLYRGFGREDETERYDQSVVIRMNTRDEEELEGGFPTEAEELFAYDAIIIDDLEADFFNYSQQSLLRDFVKQRGGGLLMLGGANSLGDGGYATTPLAQALPIYLDRAEEAPNAEAALSWNLTRDGWVEPWTRVRANETDEQNRLENMPLLKVLNPLPHVKPGARTLAIVENTRGESSPALVTRSFGNGRVACIAVGDLWRWGMQGENETEDLGKFWRQTTRWLVKDVAKKVELVAKIDTGSGIHLVATARDDNYKPLELGKARLTLRAVSGSRQADDESFESIELDMIPIPNAPGQFSVTAPLQDAGAFLAEVAIVDSEGLAVGSAETGWVSQPAVAEFASILPNRAYLEEVARLTGGRVFEANQLGQIAGEVAKRPSPIMETWSDPLWHKNWVFALAALCFLAEWMIRRRKGLA